ncbi:hypothetical protein [Stomatohabitans albus]|uniref:hypothetical protein n=1 Tax=Stomatohabitans albus TaxID=3110766 RepID=UPI00300CB4D5
MSKSTTLNKQTVSGDIPLCEQFPELFKGISEENYDMLMDAITDFTEFGRELTYPLLEEIVNLFKSTQQ